MKKLNISLIVPSNANYAEINYFFSSFLKWKKFPSEIILVNIIKKVKLNNYVLSFLKKNKIKLIMLNKLNAFPGEARNIAIKNSNFNIIAFLDTSTIAKKGWLEYGYNKIIKEKYDIVFGKTLYLAHTKKDKVILSSTYGFKSIATLPGSILNKRILAYTGIFLDNIRAGEDAEWLYRLGMYKFSKCQSKKIINYTNLQGKTYTFFLKKWFRNYSYTKKLSYLNSSKELYFIALSLFLFIISLTWNSFFSNWSTKDPLYVPHITKITILILFIFYFYLRVFLVPLKKGVNFLFILQSFPKIFIFSLLLDIVKCLAFILSKLRKY